MSNLPAYATILVDDYGESIRPSVAVSRKSRGLPKYRKINTRQVKEVTVTFYFKTLADSDAFESWYLNDIQMVLFWTFTHPVRNQIIRARFVNGEIGKAVPLSSAFAQFTRTATIEYLV